MKHEAGLSSDDKEQAFERVESLGEALRRNVDASETDVHVDEFPPDSIEGEPSSEKLEQARCERDAVAKLRRLFENCKIFLSRETPRESLAFAIRAFGGEVSWDQNLAEGSTFREVDESVTHQIVDRPTLQTQLMNRWYVQPQWVYDSINFRRVLPVEHYLVGAVLPPHYSPFVDETLEEALLFPTEAAGADAVLDDEQEAIPPAKRRKRVKDVEFAVNVGVVGGNRSRSAVEHAVDAAVVENPHAVAEERKLRELMIPKKLRGAYKKMRFGQKRKAREARQLEEKRATAKKSKAGSTAASKRTA